MVADAGFDLIHAFDTAAVDFPFLHGAPRLGLIIANTRALWPRFLAARRTDPELLAAEHPLDLYTERTLARAFPGERIWFGHTHYDGAWIPIQRLADAVGFAWLSPEHFSIHPIYGPWIGLRAVVALAGDPPHTTRITPPCTCGDRDTCTVGREHRYSDDQLRYHYTKDRALLV